MCFNTPYERIKTAKEDIPVFKIMRADRRTSIHFNWKYENHKLYKTKLGRSVIDLTGKKYINVEQGFHTYNLNRNYYYPLTLSVVEFIIPKGAKYYYNELTSEFVSDAIMMVDDYPKMKIYEKQCDYGTKNLVT